MGVNVLVKYVWTVYYDSTFINIAWAWGGSMNNRVDKIYKGNSNSHIKLQCCFPFYAHMNACEVKW